MKELKAILVVDDIEQNRALLKDVFMDQYEVLEAQDGLEALEVLRQNFHRIAVVLLDIVMPRLDGYGVLDAMHREGFSDIPVVVVTVSDQVENEVRVLDMGAADMVLMPVDPTIVKRRVINIIHAYSYQKNLENRIQLQQERMEKSYQAVVDTLRSIVVHRNMDSSLHTLHISAYTQFLLEKLALNYPEYRLNEEKIALMADASLLHDVGKILVSESTFKTNGKLTEEEKAVLEAHCVESNKIIGIFEQTGQKDFMRYATNICRCHHERWDGLGYPDALKGENIPICAQVVGLALFYDGLNYPRDYRKQYVVNTLEAEKDKRFSRRLIDCFIDNYDALEKLSFLYEDKTNDEVNKMVIQRLIKVFYKNKKAEDCSKFSQYHSLLRYVNATVYALDTEEGTYERVYSTFTDFNHVPSSGDFETEFISNIEEEIYPTFSTVVLAYFHKLLKSDTTDGELALGETCRIYNNYYGEYQWYQISSVTIDGGLEEKSKVLLILKNVNNDVSAISEMARLNNHSRGKAKDIHRYQLENKKLRIKVHIDPLTGVYDDMTTQAMVKEIIKSYPGSKYGLIMIDLDDFKLVNDQFGHLEGDKALQFFASTVKSQFRQSDIIGRVGGDAFVIFMTDIPNVDVVESKAEQLMLSLRPNDDQDGYRQHMAISVGISLYPENGLDYTTLFKKADMALFMAKKLGRNRCQIYRGDGIFSSVIEKKDDENRIIKPEDQMQVLDEFNRGLTHVIYKASTTENMIEKLLDEVARHYKLDSVFIEDASSSNMIYQWKAQENSMRHQDCGIDIRELIDTGFVKKRELWSCSDVRELPDRWDTHFLELGIGSIMLMPIYHEDKYCGLLGFTKKEKVSQWDAKIEEACRVVAKITSGTLYQEKLEQELKNYHQIYRI